MSTILSSQTDSADDSPAGGASTKSRSTKTRRLKPRWRKRPKPDAAAVRSAWRSAPWITGGLDPIGQRILGWAGGARFDVEPTQWCGYLRDFLDRFESPQRATLAESVTSAMLAATVGKWRSTCDPALQALLIDHWRACIAFGQQDDADASAVAMVLGVELPVVLHGVGITSKSDLNAALKFMRSMTQGEGFETCLLQQPHELRPTLASMIRCQTIAKASGKKIAVDVADRMFTLAGWTLALTESNGARIAISEPADASRQDDTVDTVASDAASQDDDIDRNDDDNQTPQVNVPRSERKSEIEWLERMTNIDAETFQPALDAVLGRRGGNGKLAWEVSLPESFWTDGDAGLSLMIPSWDKRRGRINLDFSGATMRIDMLAGKHSVFHGPLATKTVVDGQTLRPESGWEILCDYTDDDVHYLELEQCLSGHVRLQRQFMLLRDDDAVLIGDSVLVPDSVANDGSASDRDGSSIDEPAIIEHTVSIPIAEDYAAKIAPETREIFLSRGKKSHAMAIPLSANEWRIGPTMSTLQPNDDSSELTWQSFGGQRLYSPLWIDLQRRRFKRPRTWRRLTVAEELNIVADNDASAFRMQSGSCQWMFYRSLAAGHLRTVLGKHMMHDFFASRFDPSDGVHEELVTVEDG